MSERKMSPMELAIGAMMCTFVKYKGSDEKLSKAEFFNLLKNEMPAFPHVSTNIPVLFITASLGV